MELRGGTHAPSRYLPVHTLCSKLGPTLCHILPAVHSLTGCDVNSSLYFVGKKKVLKLISEEVGTFQELPEFTEAVVEKFLVDLYRGKKYHEQSYDDLRCSLAHSRLPLSRIPPSKPALKQHVMRASFQTKIWMNADVATLNSPSPIGNGWQKGENNALVPTMFEGLTASDTLENMICTCRKDCRDSCNCVINNLPCCELCNCYTADCENTNHDNDSSDSDSSDSDSSDSDTGY